MKNETEDLSKSLRGFTVFFVVLLSCALILVCFYIKQFEAIYRDIFGEHPLPAFTRFVVSAKIPLTILSLSIPVTSVVAVFKVVSHKNFFIIQALLILLVVGLVCFILPVLFLPLCGGIITQTGNANGQ